MPLYLADKKAILFKGEHKPVSLYLGDKKVTGYKYANSEGNHVSFEGTYNDTANVVISGKSEQTEETVNDIMGIVRPSKSIVSLDIPVSWKDLELGGKVELTASSEDETNSILICRYSSLYIGRTNTGDWNGGNSYTPSMPATDFFDGNKHTISFIINEAVSDTDNLRTVWDGAWSKTTTYYRIKFYDNQGKLLADLIPVSAGRTINGITATKDTMYNRLNGYILPIGDCRQNTINIQSGTMTPTTETQDYTSPSPDYPSPIKSVSDFDLVSAGRNLFDKVNNALVEGGLSHTTGLEDNSDRRGRTPNFIPVTESTDYIFVANVSGYRCRLILFYDINYAFLGVNSPYDASFQTLPKTAYIKALFNRIDNTAISKAEIDAINEVTQLEIGDTATPYTPFRGMQTIHFPYSLGGQGDVRDTIEYLGDGWWRHTQKWGRKVFDGTEGWGVYNPTDNAGFTSGFTSLSIVPLPVQNRTESNFAICSHLQQRVRNAVASYPYEGFFIGADNYCYIKISQSLVPSGDVAAFKAWLATQHASENPVTIEYQLAEPIITEFTAPAPQTFYPYTQFYTTGSELSPELDVTVRVME